VDGISARIFQRIKHRFNDLFSQLQTHCGAHHFDGFFAEINTAIATYLRLATMDYLEYGLVGDDDIHMLRHHQFDCLLTDIGGMALETGLGISNPAIEERVDWVHQFLGIGRFCTVYRNEI
jgi:hypothetical protein